MQKSGSKRSVVIPLILLTSVIWGSVGYTVYTYLNPHRHDTEVPDAAVQYPAFDPGGTVQQPVMHYVELKRDPFDHTVRKRVIESAPPPPPEPPVEPEPNLSREHPLEYRINGTIVNQLTALVILEDMETRQLHFLREGESYEGVTIREIGLTRVIVMERGEEVEIQLR